MDEEKLAAGGPGSSRTGVKDLFSWKSLNRPMWSYSRDVFTTFAVIALLLSFIVAFIQEFLLIVVVWAAYFLFYALSKVPPVEVEHKITTEGVVSMDKSYLWSELGPFWFTEKGDQTVLHILHSNIFGQLILLVDKKDKEKIRDILVEFLPYIETPQKSTTDKLADWFGKKFPLESMVTRNFKATDTPPAPPSAS